MNEVITYTDKEKQMLSLKQAVIEFTTSRPFDYFITLTTTRVISEDLIAEILRRFIKIMNIACFGRRSNKSIVVTPIIEKHKSDGAHVHLLMQDPRRRTETRSDINLKQTVRDAWNKASSVTADVYRSSGGSEEWFKEVYDLKTLAGYLNKQIHWDSVDSIDYGAYTGERRGEAPGLAY